MTLRFLMDEDVISDVGRRLEASYDVEYVQLALGASIKDPVVVRYAASTGRILVTADRTQGNRLKQSRAVPCLVLKDLRTKEDLRAGELWPIVLAELEIMGDQFWMEIAEKHYKVAR